MKTLFIIMLATLSLNAFADTGKCEIYYSSLEDYKLRWMDGSKDELKDATLEECVTQAQKMLGSKQNWKTLIRDDLRTLTHARYNFKGNTVKAQGSMALPGQDLI